MSQIVEFTGWKTSDGACFENKGSAEQHQKFINIVEGLDRQLFDIQKHIIQDVVKAIISNPAITVEYDASKSEE
jgi:hypothetical protein